MDIFTLVGDQKVVVQQFSCSGLPRFSILGLSSQRARELFLKTRSGMKALGLKWFLKHHQVFGLGSQEQDLSKEFRFELAIFALLSKDLLFSKRFSKVVCVGELDLSGKILETKMSELSPRFKPEPQELWVGHFKGPLHEGQYLNIKELKDLRFAKVEKIKSKQVAHNPVTAEALFELTEQEKFFLKIALHGEHSLLLLGAKNSQALHLFQLIGRHMQNSSKRSILTLQTSDTFSDWVGNKSKLGKLSQVKGGALFVADFFTLENRKKSLLKEGFKTAQEKPIFVGSHKLCPCGKARLSRPKKCGFSLGRCRSVLEKFSLDELDLFDLVSPILEEKIQMGVLSEALNKETQAFSQTLLTAAQVQKQRKQTSPNAHLSLKELRAQLSKKALSLISLPPQLSRKRFQSVLSVARTLADFEGAQHIEAHHVDQSLKWTYQSPRQIEQLF